MPIYIQKLFSLMSKTKPQKFSLHCDKIQQTVKLFRQSVKSMSLIGEIMGIAQKINAQVYWHNDLIPTSQLQNKVLY